jgi:hypothetical protein
MPEPSPQHPGIVAAYSSADHRSPTAVFRVNRRPPRTVAPDPAISRCGLGRARVGVRER